MPELNGVEEALRQTIQDLEAKIQEIQEQAQETQPLEALRAEVLETFGKALEALGVSVPEAHEENEANEQAEEAEETEEATEGGEAELTESITEEDQEVSTEEKEEEISGEGQFEEERQQLLQRISELEAESHQLRASVVADLRVRLGYVAEEKRDKELAKLVERTKESLADTYSDLLNELASRLSGDRRHPGKVHNPTYSESGSTEPEGFGEPKESDSPKGDREVVRSLLRGELPW